MLDFPARPAPSPAAGAIYRPLLWNGTAWGQRPPAELYQYFHLNNLFLMSYSFLFMSIYELLKLSILTLLVFSPLTRVLEEK